MCVCARARVYPHWKFYITFEGSTSQTAFILVIMAVCLSNPKKLKVVRLLDVLYYFDPPWPKRWPMSTVFILIHVSSMVIHVFGLSGFSSLFCSKVSFLKRPQWHCGPEIRKNVEIVHLPLFLSCPPFTVLTSRGRQRCVILIDTRHSNVEEVL